MTIARLIGLLLLILVGYHYINQPLGFSVAGSVATAIFAGCLLSVYRGYVPDGRNWVGWSLISAGCLMLAGFSAFNLYLIAPVLMVVLGYRLAELPVEGLSSLGDGGGISGDGGGGDFGADGGDGGD